MSFSKTKAESEKYTTFNQRYIDFFLLTIRGSGSSACIVSLGDENIEGHLISFIPARKKSRYSLHFCLCYHAKYVQTDQTHLCVQHP